MTSEPAAFVLVHRVAIATMVRAVGTRICRDRGWDPDDLQSDVIVHLLAKQQSPRSRYDATRSPLDYYLRRVVQSVIGHWIEREDAAKRVVTLEVEVHTDPHDGGLDDEGVARLSTVLADVRRVLADGHDTAYRTLIAWLVAEDVEVIAGVSGLTALDVLRYLAKVLCRLELRAQPRWRALWKAHRMRVYRQIKAERGRAREAPPAPLKRARGAG